MKKIKILLRDFRTMVKNGEVVNFNIGTTAHGPGAAAMLRKFLPECEIRIWASAPLSEPLNQLNPGFSHRGRICPLPPSGLSA